MMPLEFVGCIGGCDETLVEVLDLRYLRASASSRGRRHEGGRAGGGVREPPRQALWPVVPEPPRPPHPNPRPSLPHVSSWNPERDSAPEVRSRSSVDSNNDAIVCNCGQDALLLTVRKDGPNQGRQFYKCNAGSCNFFLWADEPNQSGHPQNQGPLRPSVGFRNSEGRREQRGGDQGHAGQIMCNCSETVVTLTVQKEGPNKGRMFHTCGKPRDQQCGFFQWADENMPPPPPPPGKTHTGVTEKKFKFKLCNSSWCLDFCSFVSGRYGDNVRRSGNSGSRERKTTRGAPNGPPAAKKVRTCGICRMPGHTRATCPQR